MSYKIIEKNEYGVLVENMTDKHHCVLYNYKNDVCRVDFSCVNGIPQEKCYKFISKTKSIYLDEAICDSLTSKIIELKSKKY